MADPVGVKPTGGTFNAYPSALRRARYLRERDRLLYTCMFTSQASESQEFMVRPSDFRVPSGDATATFALRTSH